MKRTTCLLSLVVGLAVFFLSACESNTYLALGQGGKIVLNPQPGDHLIWAKGIQVQFLAISPCTETGPWISECHVKKDLDTKAVTEFFYVCQKYACNDPEIYTGPGNGGLLGGSASAASGPIDDFVALQCSNGAMSITPSALPDTNIEPGAIIPGSKVHWKNVGAQINWTVAFASSPCVETSISSNGNGVCTINQAPGTYTYSASAPSCTAANGTVTTVAANLPKQ